MVKVTKNDKTFYMDGYLKKNLDMAIEVIKKDWDMMFLGDGIEGGGKSVFIQQIAYYCDPTLTIDRICFTPEEFKKAILKAEPNQAVIFDEAYRGLSSRSAMSVVNRSLNSMFAEMRQKNLFVFVVIPCFFELDRYPAIWRSRALLHIYTGAGFERGYFSFYNIAKKKQLYLRGKKYYSYHTKPNFRGRFTNTYVVNEKAYRKKKAESLFSYEEAKIPQDKARYLEHRKGLIKYLLQEGYSRKKIFKGIIDNCSEPLSLRAIGDIIVKDRKETEEKLKEGEE